MGFMDNFKVRAALLKHQKGDMAGAKADYQQLYQSGKILAQYILPYSVLLLREGGEENYSKVKEMMLKAEKASDLTPDRRQQVIMNYAVAQYKTGDLEKAVRLLEASHQKAPSGDTYGALGFLYIEAGDPEKALAYNLEALEYDEEDPVILDNLGQVYYRLLNDRQKAKEYFLRAHAIKENQIDTLYFLAQYDLEAGDGAGAKEKLQTALEGRFSPLNFVTPDMLRQQLASL